MNQDQIDSLVRTALKICGAVLIKHGLSDYAAILNTPDVVGLGVMAAGLWLSHQTHKNADRGADILSARLPRSLADTNGRAPSAAPAAGTDCPALPALPTPQSAPASIATGATEPLPNPHSP
jgi:hypothetical protein